MLHLFFSFSLLFLHAILEAILCDVGEFHCLDKETCIPEAWLCDGEPDCPDDSDETDTICKSLIPSIAHQCKTVIYYSITAPHLSVSDTFIKGTRVDMHQVMHQKGILFSFEHFWKVSSASETCSCGHSEDIKVPHILFVAAYKATFLYTSVKLWLFEKYFVSRWTTGLWGLCQRSGLKSFYERLISCIYLFEKWSAQH